MFKYISSVKSYKYLNKYKNNYLNFFKSTLYMSSIRKLWNQKKYTSHIITGLTVFTRAIWHKRVENLLKGPAFGCEIHERCPFNNQVAQG